MPKRFIPRFLQDLESLAILFMAIGVSLAGAAEKPSPCQVLELW